MGQTDRVTRIPNLRIFDRSVFGLTTSKSAAKPGPSILPLQRVRAALMWRCWTSSRLGNPVSLNCAGDAAKDRLPRSLPSTGPKAAGISSRLPVMPRVSGDHSYATPARSVPCGCHRPSALRMARTAAPLCVLAPLLPPIRAYSAPSFLPSRSFPGSSCHPPPSALNRVAVAASRSRIA